jgi:hypothetical protein
MSSLLLWAVTNVIGSMDISGWRRKSIIDKMVAWIVSHNWKMAPSALDIGNPARRKSEYLVAAKFTSPMDSK